MKYTCIHGRTQPEIVGGGGETVRGSEGHPAADDDMASEKAHLLAKRTLFSTITRGQMPPPCPPARYGPGIGYLTLPCDTQFPLVIFTKNTTKYTYKLFADSNRETLFCLLALRMAGLIYPVRKQGFDLVPNRGLQTISRGIHEYSPSVMLCFNTVFTAFVLFIKTFHSTEPVMWFRVVLSCYSMPKIGLC